MSTLDSSIGPERRVRPGALTVICVLAIVFSVLGILAGGAGLAAQLLVSRVQQAVIGAPLGDNGPATDMQREMLTRTTEITAKYNPVMIPLMILKILVEVSLLIGGIMALGLKPSGRSWLSGALTAALILEAIQFVPHFMIQRETQAVAADLLPKIIAAQPGSNGPPAGIDMSSMMSGIGTLSLIFGLVWLGAKIVLYLLGISYLRKPEVVALFPAAAPGSFSHS